MAEALQIVRIPQDAAFCAASRNDAESSPAFQRRVAVKIRAP